MATGGRGEAHVFQRDGGGPFAPDTVTERARRAWKVANSATIERARRERREVAPGELLEPIALHECRHTFAWLMIAAGVNAKALSTYLGHANISIAFDRYGHLMPGNEHEAAGLLDASARRQRGSTGAVRRRRGLRGARTWRTGWANRSICRRFAQSVAGLQNRWFGLQRWRKVRLLRRSARSALRTAR
jgi:hypothetical protein